MQCSYICLAHSYALIFEISSRKALSLDLQSEIGKGVAELYTSALNLAMETLAKQITNEARVFLNNRRLFYNAQAFIKMKEYIEEESFKKVGEGYGKMIAYYNAAYECLAAGAKDLVNLLNRNMLKRS